MSIDLATGEIVMPVLRTAYNYDVDAASKASALRCEDATRTQQQFKDECDINVIVDRFGISGKMPVNVRMPLNEEFMEIGDYQTALNTLIEADNEFMRLPAQVRERFNNSPQKLLEFANDPANLEEARKLGLALAAPGKLEPPPPVKVEIVAGTPQSTGTT